MARKKKRKKNQIPALCRIDVQTLEGGETPSSLLLLPLFRSPRAAFFAFLLATRGEGPCWQTEAKHYYSALQFFPSKPLLLLSLSLSFYSSSDTLLLFNPFSSWPLRSLPPPTCSSQPASDRRPRSRHRILISRTVEVATSLLASNETIYFLHQRTTAQFVSADTSPDDNIFLM